ncbi:MAG TPA: hypothetical protein VLB73_02635 [Patescibacteria group bacterium]|nr:hypothetical protein [Patescibacteria group bacterium]
MRKIVFIFYFLFLISFVVFSYLFVDPGLFYLRFSFTNFFQLHRVITTCLFSLSIIFFFTFYAYFLHEVNRNTVSISTIFALSIGSAAVLLFAYPAMISFDIFNYIATAKVTFFYHENPYILMPIAFTKDPLLLFMHAPNKIALYAPFWILLTAVPYILGFGNFLLILFNFKLFSAFFYLCTIFLLWKMTKSKFKTTLFALNPLVLIELLVSAHNESIMLFLFLAGSYFLFENQKGKGSVLFVLSIFIKYATAVLVPLFIYATIKQISKERFFLWTTIFMYIIFFASAFREEIYPWYTLWFFLPSIFLFKNSLFTWITTTFTFSMLLRYIPFMFIGTYFGPTPLLKIVLMWIPVLLAALAYFTTQKKKQLI